MKRLTGAIRGNGVLRFILLWATLAVAGAAWALATPLAASPDEPAHIIRAASVAGGQILGEPTGEPAVTAVRVPAGIAQASNWPCMAFNATAEASCLTSVPDREGVATASTSAGLYNPAYYALVGWPAWIIPDTSAAVMSMRLVNVILCSFFLAAAVSAMLALTARRVVVVAVAALLTPMVLFLNASVNPNGLEIASGAAMLAALLLLVRRADPEHAGRWFAVVAVSGALLAQARGISPLWLGLFGLTALIAAPPERLRALLRDWRTWVTLGVIAIAVAAAGGWLFWTGSLNRMGVFPGAGEISPARAFVEMLVGRTFDPGYVGVFGWLDTVAPPAAYAFWSFLALGMLGAAAVVARGRMLVAAAVMTATLILVPPIVQAASVQTSGYIWQGRYALVAFVGVMIVCGLAVGDRTDVRISAVSGRRFDILALLVVAGLQAFTLLQATKRYAVGVDRDWTDLLLRPDWSPVGNVIVWPFVLGLSVAAFFAVANLALPSTRDPDPAPEPGPTAAVVG